MMHNAGNTRQPIKFPKIYSNQLSYWIRNEYKHTIHSHPGIKIQQPDHASLTCIYSRPVSFTHLTLHHVHVYMSTYAQQNISPDYGDPIRIMNKIQRPHRRPSMMNILSCCCCCCFFSPVYKKVESVARDTLKINRYLEQHA